MFCTLKVSPQKNIIQMSTLIDFFRLWQWKTNSETKSKEKKGTK